MGELDMWLQLALMEVTLALVCMERRMHPQELDMYELEPIIYVYATKNSNKFSIGVKPHEIV